MILLLLACTGAHTADPPPARTEEPEVQVTASLVAEPEALADGEAFFVAVRYALAPGWHVYWSNPGETGLATSAELRVPQGFSAEAVRYPGPERFVSPGDITSYGYEQEAALLFRVQPPAELGPGPHAFSASTDWLACKSVCIKGQAELSLALPGAGADLSAFVQRLPKPFASQAGAEARWSEDRAALTLTLPGAREAAYFPDEAAQLALTDVLSGEAERAATLTLRFKAPVDLPPGGVLRITPPRGAPYYLELPES
ncbi:MAG: hypothetical protein H6741_08075 [Alphaproteobacteria bacterium]|nr:hypothetical protein [Alphaproteobacteria bacterium]